ncbi:unnamed protein product [Rotaria socialis]|uniref:TIR domain-containing protein n=1 Tax=Rotaria socialis TaxID=392032 RepID=A0A817SGP5_9BILA|nr:unnamed protein product [Rotaria socialis]CAF4331633.1 unnamed protein product [Rotaria socialis]
MTAIKIETQLSQLGNNAKNVDEQDSSSIANHGKFQENSFFQKHLPQGLCEVLEHWYSDGTLKDEEQEIFRNSTEYLLASTKTDPSAKEWISRQTELIDLTDKCLNEIGSYGYYIGIIGTEDPSLKSFMWLIQAFENAQCKQLLHTLVKCVTSQYYIDVLSSLISPMVTSLNTTHEFLLITCPNYIVTCDTEKSYSSEIPNKLLHQYNEILSEFLPHIGKWTSPVMSCLFYPMEFILPAIRSLSFEQRRLMYKIILALLLHIQENHSNTDAAHVKLIYTSLCLLIAIVRSDRVLSNQLKKETEEKSDLIKILSSLSKGESNEQIQLKAVELISLLVPEDEFRKENSTERVTGLFLKNFNAAVHDGKPKNADEVLKGFRDLIQNDDVKEEVMKQDALPSIIKFAKESIDDPLPLEVVYSMAFNKDGNKVIREDKEFVDHVKVLRDSEIRGVSKMAHGIMWKIEGEEKFKQKEEEKARKREEDKNEKNECKAATIQLAASPQCAEIAPPQYDMMISYCWAQQPLCHRINDRLEKDGYKVWLDRDEMRGSIIESMADAIENSKFVLLCMSSNYKKSINCKAEAEYAFSRHSKIIPLIVEPNYKADGWLGFMAGSKIYVDFADKEDEEFDKAYNLLIEELKRNGLIETLGNSENKTDQTNGATGSKPEEPTKPIEPTKPKEPTQPEEPEKPIVSTKEYLNFPEASMWSNQHVLEFLTDKKLDQLIPICEAMDGETLIEFYQSCARMPDIMYGLFNNSKEQPTISINTLFSFLAKLKKYLPPKPERKVYFQYNFVYPPSNKAETEITSGKKKP